MVLNGGTQGRILDAVIRFLQAEKWSFQQVNRQPVIRAGYHGERGTWICYFRANEPQRQFLFHALMGLNVPPANRAAVVEFLNRVNYTLVTGCFEMNMETGEVRSRAGLEAPEGELSPALIGALVHASLRQMDTYFPGVLAVVHAGLSPEAALARLECQVVSP